jgi:hypothetical protein
MPMTFGEAYKIVCPDGCPVVPHSREHRDIVELMRQSGHLHYTERLVHESVPIIPTRVEHVRQFTARDTITPAPLKVSKSEWLSIHTNREAFKKHLEDTPPPLEIINDVIRCVEDAPVVSTKLSKLQWAINNINKNNSA